MSSNQPFTHSPAIRPPRPISDAVTNKSKIFLHKGSFHSSTQNLSSFNPLNDGYLLPDETKEILRSRRIDALALFDSSIEPSIPLPPPTAPIPSPINFSEAYKPLSNSTQSSTQSEPTKVDYAKLSEFFDEVNLNSPSILTPNTCNSCTLPNNSPPLVSIHEAYKSSIVKDFPTTNLKRNTKTPTLNISSQNKKIPKLLFQKSPPVIKDTKYLKKTVLSSKITEKKIDAYCNEEEMAALQHRIKNGKYNDPEKYKNGRSRRTSKTNEDLFNGNNQRNSKNNDQLSKTYDASEISSINKHETLSSNGKRKERHKTGHSEEYRNHTELNSYNKTTQNPHQTTQEFSQKSHKINQEPTKNIHGSTQKTIQDLMAEMGGFVSKEQVKNALESNNNNYTESLKQLKEDTLYNMGLVSLDRCKSILAFHCYDLSVAIRSITNSSSV